MSDYIKLQVKAPKQTTTKVPTPPSPPTPENHDENRLNRSFSKNFQKTSQNFI